MRQVLQGISGFLFAFLPYIDSTAAFIGLAYFLRFMEGLGEKFSTKIRIMWKAIQTSEFVFIISSIRKVQKVQKNILLIKLIWLTLFEKNSILCKSPWLKKMVSHKHSEVSDVGLDFKHLLLSARCSTVATWKKVK